MGNVDEEYTLYQLSEYILPVTGVTISKETKRDNELRDLYNRLQTGRNLNGTPFSGQESELMLENGCIYKRIRVIIPLTFRKRILNELHTAHIGIVKMKALARSYCYWNSIDNDIEAMVKSCRDCARVAKEPAKVPIHTWELPSMPWQRIHIDFAGPFMEHYFLVVVDAKSKWLEVIPMKKITSYYTIRSLREILARFGLPTTIVSDNGSNFTSVEFQEFLKSNGIYHRRTAPAHPSTNGQAERYVQTLKDALRCAMNDPGDLHVKLQRFLLQNHKVPNASTGKSPAEVMLKYNLRSRIDLIKPNDKVNDYSNKNVIIRSGRELSVGDNVQIRFYQNKVCKWEFGKILRRDGHLHYIVEVDGREQRRHIDQIRKTLVDGNTDGYSSTQRFQIRESVSPQIIINNNDDINNNDNSDTDNHRESITNDDGANEIQQGGASTSSVQGDNITPSVITPGVSGNTIKTPTPIKVRRSDRNRRPPNKLNL